MIDLQWFSTCGCDDSYCDCSSDTIDTTPDLAIHTIIPRHSLANSAQTSTIDDYNTAVSWLNKLYQRTISQGLKFSDDIIILWYRTQILKQNVNIKYLASTISYLANREFQDFLNGLSIGGGSVYCPSDCGGYCGSYSYCGSYCGSDGSVCDSSCDCGCDDSCDCGDCGCDDYCGCDDTGTGPCSADSCLECADCGCDDNACDICDDGDGCGCDD